VGALVGRGVDLQADPHAEHPLGALAEEDQVVEGRQQRPGGHAPRSPRCGREVGDLVPAAHRDGLKLAGGGQLGDPRPAVGERQAEIVAQVALGGDAQGCGRDPHQLALRRLPARRRRLAHGLGQDPGRQAVDPLEGPAPGRRHQLAAPEQGLGGALGLAPAPPAAGAALSDLQRRGGEGAVAADLVQRLVHQVAALMQEPGDPLPRADALAGVVHPPPHEGLGLDRHERGLMAPVLEQPGPFPPRQVFKGLARIGAEAREERQVVRPDEHVDRVDLQNAEAADHPQQVVAADRACGARSREALGAQGDAPRLGGGDLGHAAQDRALNAPAGRRSAPPARRGTAPSGRADRASWRSPWAPAPGRDGG
jgi:hypothetical protein